MNYAIARSRMCFAACLLIILAACGGGNDGPPTILSITITPSVSSIALGLTQQFTATATYSNEQTRDLTTSVSWSTGSAGVASVSNAGLVHTVAVGSTQVIATSGGIKGAATVNVTSAIVTSIAINPNPSTAAVAIPTSLTAIGTFSDGSTSDVTAKSTWTSSATGIATVGSATGVVIGVAVGSATIRASIASVSGTVPVTITTDVWIATGAPTISAAGAAVILLANGKVLVAGGQREDSSNSDTVALATSELYEPATGKWAPTGNLNIARISPTATLLQNGMVLIAGGTPDDSTDSFASAELYNPTSGTWSLTGTMNALRVGHTATLLPNGEVLVTGGVAGGDVYSSAELYNPGTATWSLTASMANHRLFHAATLLTNGKVLVSGGDNFIENVSTTEVYDTSSGTWADSGTMVQPRSGHEMTVLSTGQVLALGGHVITGTAYSLCSTVELYDPATGIWSATIGALSGAYPQTATVLNSGSVLAVGYTTANGSELMAQIFDPASASWTSLAAPPFLVAPVLLPSGLVLGVGVAASSGGAGQAVLFDPLN